MLVNGVPGDAMGQWTGLSLFQVIAYFLFGTEAFNADLSSIGSFSEIPIKYTDI